MTAQTLPDAVHAHGLVDGLDFDEYLALPALSASSARKLLPPSCPALFRQDQLTPKATTAMDLGKVAHAVILEDVALADIAAEVAGDWRTKGPKAEVEAAREAGLIVLHTEQADAVRGMIAGIRANPMAAALFDPESGRPEQSMFWTEPRSGAARKGRLDFLPARRSSGRLIIPDFKSAKSADPYEWGRSAMDLGYHQQAAGYEEGALALGLDDDPQLLFVVQETRPPYLVVVCELDAAAMAIGRELNRWACTTYARCVESGVWPGHNDHDVQQVSLPGWYVRQYEEMTK